VKHHPGVELMNIITGYGHRMKICLLHYFPFAFERCSYLSHQASRSPRQIAEERVKDRAAHGPDVEPANIFTGEHYLP